MTSRIFQGNLSPTALSGIPNQPALGCTLLNTPVGRLHLERVNIMAENHHVAVDVANSSWNSGFSLEPNTSWLIVPSATSTYTLNGGATNDTFHGSSWMDGNEIGIPAQVRLGGLAVLVWHHQSDGNPIPQIITFPPSQSFAEVAVGPNGGSMFFIIADKAATYGDNHGVCEVDIVGTHFLPSSIFIHAQFHDTHARNVAAGLAQSAVQAAREGDVDSATKFGTAAARIDREHLDGGQADRLAEHVNLGGEPSDFDVGPPISHDN